MTIWEEKPKKYLRRHGIDSINPNYEKEMDAWLNKVQVEYELQVKALCLCCDDQIEMEEKLEAVKKIVFGPPESAPKKYYKIAVLLGAEEGVKIKKILEGEG